MNRKLIIYSFFMLMSFSQFLFAEADLESRILRDIRNLASHIEMEQRQFARSDLIRIGSPAVPFLIKAMESDKYIFVRVESALILGKIKDEQAVPTLVDQLKSSKETNVQKACACALVDIGGDRASQAIDKSLIFLFPITKIQVIDALIERGDQRGIAVLVAMLRDIDPEIRKMSAWVLTKTGEPLLLEQVSIRKEEEDSEVKEYIKGLLK